MRVLQSVAWLEWCTFLCTPLIAVNVIFLTIGTINIFTEIYIILGILKIMFKAYDTQLSKTVSNAVII